MVFDNRLHSEDGSACTRSCSCSHTPVRPVLLEGMEFENTSTFSSTLRASDSGSKLGQHSGVSWRLKIDYMVATSEELESHCNLPRLLKIAILKAR